MPHTDNYYDSIARGYDELHLKEQEAKMVLIKDNICIGKDSRILDIACGTGISSSYNCFCIGMDASRELLKIAGQKDSSPNHKYILSRAEDLPLLAFNDGEFDYVTCISALHLFSSLDAVLDEIRRVGKRYVLTVLKESRRRDELISKIMGGFSVDKRLDSGNEIIFILSKKQLHNSKGYKFQPQK